MAIKIAVVDDQEVNTELFVTFIQENFSNVEVLGFTSPQNACKEIVEQGNFDIILTDGFMPSMEGVEVAKAIFKKYRPFVVVVSVVATKLKEQYNEIFDYAVNKDTNQLSNLYDILVEIIDIIKNDKALKQINELLPGTIKPKNKIFLKDVLLCVLLNKESKNTYETLSDTLDRSEGWIKKKISNILSISYQDFGFKNKPTNIEFIRVIQERIEENTEEQRKAVNEQ